ncbi:hypothetical protein Q7P37_004877 [Cladosporium fusiforme]
MAKPGFSRFFSLLPDPKAHIRLFKFAKTSSEQRLEVELDSRSVKELPCTDYYAISYVWGPRPNTHTISIGEETLHVRTNCWKALHQARRYPGNQEEQYYWIDAICINQMDQNEKSDQVQLMGQIFNNATKVLSCVGDHKDKSEDVMNLLDTAPENLVGEEWPGICFGWRALQWLGRQPDGTIRAVSKGLEKMLERPYFTRVWIIQEVFRKQSETILCCGNQYTSFKALFALKRAFFYSQYERPIYNVARWLLDSSFTKGNFKDINPKFAGYDFPSRTSSFLLDVSFLDERYSKALGGKTTDGGRDGLEEVLDMTSGFQCKDSRDRVYGTLQLVDWKSRAPIRADYNKSRFELAMEVLRHGWKNENYRTMASIVRLTEILGLFEKDETHANSDQDQFQKTKEAIITRCQANSNMTKDEFICFCPRPQWREVTTEDAADPKLIGQGNTAVVMANAVDQGEDNSSITASSGASASHSSPRPQTAHRTILVELSSDSTHKNPSIASLHLSKARSASSNEMRYFDLYLVPEEALIIAFVIASIENGLTEEMEMFLEELRNLNFRFLSYAQVL